MYPSMPAFGQLGFMFMALTVYGSALKVQIAARSGRISEHMKWPRRYLGSLWGSYWLYRLLLLVLGPIFREYETVAILLVIWVSSPLGIAIAELAANLRDYQLSKRHTRLSKRPR